MNREREREMLYLQNSHSISKLTNFFNRKSVMHLKKNTRIKERADGCEKKIKLLKKKVTTI